MFLHHLADMRVVNNNQVILAGQFLYRIRFKILKRAFVLLKKIEQSINRIDAGDYGYCDETGEPIGVGPQLKLRTSNEIFTYPVLRQLLAEQPTVSVSSYIADINGFYDDCDAFILPSVDDGFGLSLIEAIARGVPSIATRNCGASELLVPDREFLLIDAFSVEQIKDAVLRLYESRDVRERLVINGPVAIAALQEGGLARPYEEGVDRLFEAMSTAKNLQSFA